MQTPPPEEVPSPCIAVCRLDKHRICIGCGRLASEIAIWREATSAQRLAILHAASSRREVSARLHPNSSPSSSPNQQAD